MKMPNLSKKHLAEGLLSILVIGLGLYQLASVLRIGNDAANALNKFKINREISQVCNPPAYSQGYVSQARHNQLLQDYLVSRQSYNQIQNPNLVTPDPDVSNQPQNWSFVPYGNLSASGNYSQTDPHSVTIRVTAADPNSGANWAPKATPVQPNSHYIYSDWYKSNVPTVLSIQTTLDDGRTLNDVLAQVSPSSDWTEAIAEVFVPANATSITVTHIINQPGELSTRNFVLAPGQVPGFDQGIVSVSFDDGWAGIYKTAFPLLEQYGLHSTQYIISDYTGYTNYMDQSMLKHMLAAGNEIASHSTRHADQTTLMPDQLQNSLARSRVTLQQLDIPVTSFASPYGITNDTTLSEISRCYLAQRGTLSGYNSRLYDPYYLKVQNILPTTTADQLNQWLASAKQDHTWLILVYHDVDDKALGGFTVNKETLSEQFQAIKSSGLNNLTIQQALESTSAAINQK